MPDWKIPGDYPKKGEYPPEGWAWEFLRRNPAYRADHQLVQAALARLSEKYANAPVENWLVRREDPAQKKPGPM